MWQQAIRAHTPKQQRSSKGNHGYPETEPLKSWWARWGRLLGGVNPLCSHASRLQNPPSEHLSQKHTQVNNNTAAWLRFCGDEGDRESGSGQFAARSDWHGPQRWGGENERELRKCICSLLHFDFDKRDKRSRRLFCLVTDDVKQTRTA